MSIFLIFTLLENKLSTQHNLCDQNYSIFNQLGLNVFSGPQVVLSRSGFSIRSTLYDSSHIIWSFFEQVLLFMIIITNVNDACLTMIIHCRMLERRCVISCFSIRPPKMWALWTKTHALLGFGLNPVNNAAVRGSERFLTMASFTSSWFLVLPPSPVMYYISSP